MGSHDLYLGVKGLSNVNIVDRTYSQADNTFDTYLDNLHRIARSAPIGGIPITASVPTAAMIAHYGGLFNANDLVAHVAYNISSNGGAAIPSTWQIAAWLIEERYLNFTQGFQHMLKFRHFSSINPDPIPLVSLDRDLVVEPSGGVNTTSEYIVLPMTPDLQLSTPNDLLVGADLLPIINDAGKGRRSLLYPLPMYTKCLDPKGLQEVENSAAAAVIIFERCAINVQASITVTPVYVTQDSLRTLDRLLGSFKEQKHA